MFDEKEYTSSVEGTKLDVFEESKHRAMLEQRVNGLGQEVIALRNALSTAYKKISSIREAVKAGEVNRKTLVDILADDQVLIQTDFAFDVRIGVEEELNLAQQGLGLKIDALKYGTVSADGASIVGHDGFLFIHGGSNAWGNQIQGAARISDELLSQSVADINEFQMNCDKRGISHCISIIPEKDIVYPECSPNCEGVTLGTRSIHILKDIFPEIRYPIEELLSAKNNSLVYHKNDSHFNVFGGLAVSNDILKRLGLSAIDYGDIPFQHRQFSDDLSVKWEAHPTTRRVVPFEYTENTLQDGNPLTGLHILLRSHSIKNGKTIMIFGDSYSWNPDSGISRFMTRSFENVHFIWTRNIDWNLVDVVSPNAIVMESAERFLIGGINYRKAM